uniref:Uncharacterized protein n=1 Tax=Myotis myotis TaxID=51298 RepID=A0A7J7WI48_MYOMY|nr:hypothetical protein mMyoMyo1_012183 [Myotis myotis]
MEGGTGAVDRSRSQSSAWPSRRAQVLPLPRPLFWLWLIQLRLQFLLPHCSRPSTSRSLAAVPTGLAKDEGCSAGWEVLAEQASSSGALRGFGFSLGLRGPLSSPLSAP